MDLSQKQVLVTGASGFVGGALARRLVAEGARVRALTHSQAKLERLAAEPGMEGVFGNVTDPEAMRRAAHGCDLVYHLAVSAGTRLDRAWLVNVEGTRAVAEAAAAAGVQRMIHFSSVSAYGFAVSGVVTEETPLRPGRYAYNRTKAAGEAVLQEVARRTGLPWSVLRPAYIYGPGSPDWTAGIFRLATRPLAGGRFTLWLGDGSGHAHPVFVEDVVDLALHLATDQVAVGQVFNCGPEHPPTWREFLGGYARLAGSSRWLGLPPWIAATAAPLLERLLRLVGRPIDLPDLVRQVQADTRYSIDKAQRLLGWQPKTDLHTGTQLCAPWLRAQGLL